MNDLRERQVALGMCVRMTDQQIGEVLGLTPVYVRNIRRRLLDQAGMGDSIEFARQQNAAVREALHGEA